MMMYFSPRIPRALSCLLAASFFASVHYNGSVMLCVFSGSPVECSELNFSGWPSLGYLTSKWVHTMYDECLGGIRSGNEHSYFIYCRVVKY